MIFGYIRVRKDWISAHILKNCLEHKSDTAHREVEAPGAADLKVKKKIYLDKRVRTHENPLFTKWCRGRMNRAPSEEERSDELLQEKKISSIEENMDIPLPGKRTFSMEEESKENFQVDWKTDSKMVSSKPSAQMKHDEKFQDGRKTMRKPTTSLNNDEKIQVGWRGNRKQRSPNYVRLNLQVKKTWYDSLSDEDKKEKLQVKTEKATKELESENGKDNDDESTQPSRNVSKLDEVTKVNLAADNEDDDSESTDPPKDDNKSSDIKEVKRIDDEMKILKCNLCDYNFESMRADLDKTTLAVHFRIKHPLEKRGYRRLIHGIKKLGPTIIRSHRRNRPDHRINFWAKKTASTHASVTSQKSPKRSRRKKEFIRTGALLPDNIRLNNYVTCTRMSQKDFNSQCANLTSIRECSREVMCDAHSSLYKLKQISQKLKQILSQSSDVTSDWKKFKKVHSRNYGYLSSAINHPEIWKEIELISKLVNDFNKCKENLEEYKEAILRRFSSSVNPLRQQAPSKPKPERFWRFTRYRKPKEYQECLKPEAIRPKKVSYSEEEFKTISLQAFYSPAIKETMTSWERDGAFQIPKTTLEAVNNIKNHYPRIRAWNPLKILQRLSTNWSIRHELQDKQEENENDKTN